MMEVQKYIQEFGWDALQAEPLNIKIRFYEETGIAVLNYSQIESPKNHPIVVECRSLILSYPQGEVVSRSFDRFYNYGECPDFYTDFDINRAEVYEKEDGSLIKLYYCPQTGRWEISTRSQAFAEGDHVLGGRFRDWILKAMKLTEEQFQHAMNRNVSKSITINCEYTGSDNRIVRQYTENSIVLLSVRNNQDYFDYVELDRDTSKKIQSDLYTAGMNIRLVKSYSLGSFEEIIQNARDLPCLEEGYVCYDPVSGKRVKIKNPSYTAIHHLRDNGTPSLKRVTALVLENDYDEYLVYFECDRHLFTPVIEEVEKFKSQISKTWEQVKMIENQKEFALAVKDYSYSGILFIAKRTKENPVHVFNNLTANKQLSYFGF